ncbi:hypothetical protein KUCAC02_011054 [Chaenocephalus aceratus]|uniref:Uncharacterized protein n=1 Tax=Chaenocephalus aceratus TaxID=36190 RepID=A0ACB9WVR2_CHAAC|nr:hypothetical protein KUCAC02_011054 [Chaenocephalus aceratus]
MSLSRVVGSTSSVSGPVICEHCGITFPSAQSLSFHSRSTHLLYTCPCCGKHFHHSANLTRHMAVHRGGNNTEKTTGQNSLHEQEERERAATIREEEQECLVTEQMSLKM